MSKIPVYFLCTKCDLLPINSSDIHIEVNEERSKFKDKVNQMNSLLFECSALTKEGIKEAFETVIISVGSCYSDLRREKS